MAHFLLQIKSHKSEMVGHSFHPVWITSLTYKHIRMQPIRMSSDIVRTPLLWIAFQVTVIMWVIFCTVVYGEKCFWVHGIFFLHDRECPQGNNRHFAILPVWHPVLIIHLWYTLYMHRQTVQLLLTSFDNISHDAVLWQWTIGHKGDEMDRKELLFFWYGKILSITSIFHENANRCVS